MSAKKLAGCLAAMLLLLSAACGALDNGGSGDDDSAGDDDGGGQGTTIYDLQQGDVDPGTRVTLKEVVVTSQLGADSTGFFVEEQDRGPYSGIYVYVTGEASGEIAPVVGDVINISGTYDEYNDTSELTLEAVGDYEIIDNIGDLEPDVVDPDELAQDSDDAEQWEGVLVRIEDVEVTNTNPDDPSDYGEFLVAGDVRIDDFFFPVNADPNPPAGEHFDALIGPFTYSFETYKLCPRGADDFVGDWQPANGPADATIYEVQQGDYLPGDGVTVTGVITSPVNYEGDTFFIEDPGAGPYSGVAVYMYTEVAAVFDGQVGDVITLTATVTDYYGATELTLKSPTDFQITGTADPPGPDTLDLSDDLSSWEGVLVKVEDVEVTVAPNSYGEFEVTNADGSVTVGGLFFADGHWADYPIAAGDQFAAIVGVLNYSYETFMIEPRTDADLTE